MLLPPYLAHALQDAIDLSPYAAAEEMISGGWRFVDRMRSLGIIGSHVPSQFSVPSRLEVLIDAFPALVAGNAEQSVSESGSESGSQSGGSAQGRSASRGSSVSRDSPSKGSPRPEA